MIRQNHDREIRAGAGGWKSCVDVWPGFNQVDFTQQARSQPEANERIDLHFYTNRDTSLKQCSEQTFLSCGTVLKQRLSQGMDRESCCKICRWTDFTILLVLLLHI